MDACDTGRPVNLVVVARSKDPVTSLGKSGTDLSGGGVHGFCLLYGIL